MRKLIFPVFFTVGVLMLFSLTGYAQTSRKRISAAEANGTFRMDFEHKYRDLFNEIKILVLGGGKLRFAMDLINPYTLPDGEITGHLGKLDGEAVISGDTAIYRSSEFGPCRITIKFVRRGAIKVTQSGSDADCGFGRNVFSTGTYRKVSGKKPTFDSE